MTLTQKIVVPSLLDAQEWQEPTEATVGAFKYAEWMENAHPTLLTKFTAEKSGPGTMALQARLEEYSPDTRVSAFLGALLSGIAEANIAQLTLWAYTLHIMQQEKLNMITSVDVRLKFPNGLPTKPERLRIWLEQKGHRYGLDVDNLLDHKITWS